MFFVESTLLVTVASGSFGQLICRIAVVRLDTKPVGFPRALLRQALICLALPPLVIGPDRRGLQDLAASDCGGQPQVAARVRASWLPALSVSRRVADMRRHGRGDAEQLVRRMTDHVSLPCSNLYREAVPNPGP